MNSRYTSEEWIEKAMDGTLNELELPEFNQKVMNDPEFAEMYYQQLRLKEAWIKAHQLERTRAEIRKAILHEKARKKKLVISYAAAASILVVIALSAFLYSDVYFRKKSPDVVQSKTPDSLQEITLTPQYKTAEEKAAFGVADTIMLITPVMNRQFSLSDSIIFRWSPALRDSSHIIIYNGKSDKPLFKEKLKAGNERFILEPGFLPTGMYKWRLEGYISEGNFKINP